MIPHRWDRSHQEGKSRFSEKKDADSERTEIIYTFWTSGGICAETYGFALARKVPRSPHPEFDSLNELLTLF